MRSSKKKTELASPRPQLRTGRLGNKPWVRRGPASVDKIHDMNLLYAYIYSIYLYVYIYMYYAHRVILKRDRKGESH